MSSPHARDRLEVVNGPEDGTAYPLTRSPLHIGRAADCDVCLAMDPRLAPRNVLLSAVGDGYRVRWLDGASVSVDGRRAGLIRSRIVRHGGIIAVGHTQLALLCAPDGLASRSFGLPVTSDVVWAMRRVAAFARDALRGLLRLLFGRRLRLLRAAIVFGLLWFGLRTLAPQWLEPLYNAMGWAWHYLNTAYYEVARWLARLG